MENKGAPKGAMSPSEQLSEERQFHRDSFLPAFHRGMLKASLRSG